MEKPNWKTVCEAKKINEWSRTKSWKWMINLMSKLVEILVREFKNIVIDIFSYTYKPISKYKRLVIKETYEVYISIALF